MAITLTFLGHAAFLIESGDAAIAIDPFLTGNPVAARDAKDLVCQYIALTHGHADHLGDTVAIATANKATVFAAFEIAEFLGQHGVTAEPGNPGGRIVTDFGWVAFTQAFHSSSYNGQYMGMPCGVVVHIGGVTVYHCGDTALFSDMKLIGELYQPDMALIPIGDRFTMGPELASRAAEWIRPKIAVPMHYKTWPLLASDASGFTPKGVEVRVMEPGASLSFPS